MGGTGLLARVRSGPGPEGGVADGAEARSGTKASPGTEGRPDYGSSRRPISLDPRLPRALEEVLSTKTALLAPDPDPLGKDAVSRRKFVWTGSANPQGTV